MVRAAFKKPIERTPVWVMRQAGRYLPEYRKVREKAGSFLSLCKNPEYAVEVSLQPVNLMEVDAAIMFSDILTPLMGMGVKLDFNPGPVIFEPIRNHQQIDRLIIPDPSEAFDYVGKLLNILKRETADRVPVIGFAGAPFTLASYLVEGGNSKVYRHLMTMLFDNSKAAHALMDRLADMTIAYLNYQIESGADILQLFDTWAGILNRDDFQQFVLPYVTKIFSNLNKRGEVPVIYYINGSCHLLSQMVDTGADVVSLDWRSDIGEVKAAIGDHIGLQGNMNPNILFCRQEIIYQKVKLILEKMGPESGHIFNLGHGIDKDVNPENLLFMVRTVKELSRR